MLDNLNTEMSRSEKLKEEIGWLKVVFGILAAIDVSLLAWLAQNYRSANALLLVIGALAVAGIAAAVVWVNHGAYQHIKRSMNWRICDGVASHYRVPGVPSGPWCCRLGSTRA
ncbi:MAG: hypothetical protein ACRER2_19670 [Methylococcales bacterium]